MRRLWIWSKNIVADNILNHLDTVHHIQTLFVSLYRLGDGRESHALPVPYAKIIR